MQVSTTARCANQREPLVWPWRWASWMVLHARGLADNGVRSNLSASHSVRPQVQARRCSSSTRYAAAGTALQVFTMLHHSSFGLTRCRRNPRISGNVPTGQGRGSQGNRAAARSVRTPRWTAESGPRPRRSHSDAAWRRMARKGKSAPQRPPMGLGERVRPIGAIGPVAKWSALINGLVLKS